MAAGGKGAPLVPYLDYMLMRHRGRGRVAVNIGGISNLTAIPPNTNTDRVIAFDTGPGNMVIDQLVTRITRVVNARPGRRNGSVRCKSTPSCWPSCFATSTSAQSRRRRPAGNSMARSSSLSCSIQNSAAKT